MSLPWAEWGWGSTPCRHLLRGWGSGARLTKPRACGLDLPHDIHAAQDAPEDDVVPIEPRRLMGRDEELAAVGVRAWLGLARVS